MNAPALHHYPATFPSTYGLAPTFQRQAPFPSMYGAAGLGSGGLGYSPHQSATDWDFHHGSSNLAMNLNGTLNGTSASANFLSTRDSAAAQDYFTNANTMAQVSGSLSSVMTESMLSSGKSIGGGGSGAGGSLAGISSNGRSGSGLGGSSSAGAGAGATGGGGAHNGVGAPPSSPYCDSVNSAGYATSFPAVSPASLAVQSTVSGVTSKVTGESVELSFPFDLPHHYLHLHPAMIFPRSKVTASLLKSTIIFEFLITCNSIVVYIL